ncbi:unnamed protein product, partial [Chrysoparadoxa australica]
MWNSILGAASNNKAKSQDSYILLLGSKSCGKTHLIEQFRPVQAAAEEGVAPGEEAGDAVSSFHPALAYSYFDAHDPEEFTVERDEAPSKVSVWQCSEREYGYLLGSVMQPSQLLHTVGLIALDLSKPWEALPELEAWAELLRKLVESKMAVLSEEQQQQMLETARQGIPKDSLKINFGIPIVVVGCKADTLKCDSFDAQQRLLFLQQRLRLFCLDHGASLVYTSSKTGLNTARLLQVTLSLLYAEAFSSVSEATADEQEAEGTPAAGAKDVDIASEGVFIPAGWDNHELIETLLPAEKTSWEVGCDFNDVIAPPTAAKSQSAMMREEELEPEEAWLLKLSDSVQAGAVRRSSANIAMPASASASVAASGLHDQEGKPDGEGAGAAAGGAASA